MIENMICEIGERCRRHRQDGDSCNHSVPHAHRSACKRDRCRIAFDLFDLHSVKCVEVEIWDTGAEPNIELWNKNIKKSRDFFTEEDFEL